MAKVPLKTRLNRSVRPYLVGMSQNNRKPTERADSPEVAAPEAGSSSASMKSQQEFDISQTQKTARSSSWAFWQTANQPQPTEEPKSWLPWQRSASSPSLNDMAEQDTTQSTNRTWSIWSLGQMKPNATDESQDRPKEIIGATNTILSQDAVLFEPAKTKSPDSIVSEETTLSTNKVVPSLQECLPLASIGTAMYTAYQKYSRKLGAAPQESLHLSRTAPKTIKRVLIVGIHGFFPTKMLRPLLGEPTGTSIRFAHEAERSVLNWAKQQGLEVAIQKIALEKEGKVMNRVEFFFELMNKWQDEIKQADFVFVAAHSQGCPVAILLMSKLIEHGLITEEQRVGILAMAGINNGPYFGIDQKFFVRAYSTIENESMLELFEFQKFDSLLSRKYLESLRRCISHNVKIAYVGSIDDQLVPLYSAIASHALHPNIYRAVYIDGTSNTPDFVSRIVSLSCSLINLGYSDHGVIKEISRFLAGPLTGGGHSRIYNDLSVYQLGLEFFLSTNDLNAQVPQPVHYKGFDIKQLGTNPFHLPWCMRGLIFETTKRLPQGKEQIELMFKEFDEWQPESKVLKDMKYRLNGIRMNL